VRVTLRIFAKLLLVVTLVLFLSDLVHETVHMFQLHTVIEFCLIGYKPDIKSTGWVTSIDAVNAPNLEIGAYAIQLIFTVLFTASLFHFLEAKE
jgi:hypothetical protein